MSDSLLIEVVTHEDFTLTNVVRGLTAIKQWIDGHWNDVHLFDKWSNVVPECPVKPEEWARKQPYDRPGFDPAEEGGLGINLFPIDFSPVSLYLTDLEIRKERPEGTLTIMFHISDHVLSEGRYLRERRRLELEYEDVSESLKDEIRECEQRHESHPSIDSIHERMTDIQDDYGCERVWPQNRRALLQLVDELKKEFPKSTISMDEAIRTEPSTN